MKFILCFYICFLSIKANSQIITTFAGNGGVTYAGDGGSATTASIGFPGSITFDRNNNCYFSELNNTIRKVSTDGIITTYAGNGTTGYSGDNGPATAAQFNFTGGGGIAFDSSNNLYIVDQANNCVRKVNTTTKIVNTVIGTGSAGFGGDGGSAELALLNSPSHITIDKHNNIYIFDAGNKRIRKVNSSGIITTVAGNGTNGFSGDGSSALSAAISTGGGIHIRNSSDLYIADGVRIRKVNIISGIINTIAGSGTAGYGGDGGTATSASFYGTMDVRTDQIGNIYVSDASNNRIRKINLSGIISTIAGNGGTGYSGDFGTATLAEIYSPRGIAFDTCNNLYIVDNGNHRIRKVTFNPDCKAVVVKEVEKNNSTSLRLYPNPVQEALTVSTTEPITSVCITNVLGQVVAALPASPKGR